MPLPEKIAIVISRVALLIGCLSQIVNKIPKIVGNWPKLKKGEDFSDWLADGGTPPSGQ